MSLSSKKENTRKQPWKGDLKMEKKRISFGVAMFAALAALAAWLLVGCGCPGGNGVYCALPATVPDGGVVIVYPGDRPPVVDAATDAAPDASVDALDAGVDVPASDGTVPDDAMIDVPGVDVVIDASVDVPVPDDVPSDGMIDASMPDVPAETGSDVVIDTADTGVDAPSLDVASDVTLDAPTSDVLTDTASDAAPDTSVDVLVDTGVDMPLPDVVSDVAADTSTPDVLTDTGSDVVTDAPVDAPRVPDLRVEYRQMTSGGAVPAIMSSIRFGFDQSSMTTFALSRGELFSFTGSDGSTSWWYAEMLAVPSTAPPTPRYAYAVMPAGACGYGTTVSCPSDWNCNWRAIWHGRVITCATMIAGASAIAVILDHGECFRFVHEDAVCARFDLSSP